MEASVDIAGQEMIVDYALFIIAEAIDHVPSRTDVAAQRLAEASAVMKALADAGYSIVRSEPTYEACREAADKIETLYDAIAHGDDAHRVWLKQAIEDHFAGRAVARPNS